MASISTILRKKPNKQGLYPIAIRITKDRKSSFISIGQKIEEKHWDEINKKVKKSHPNSGRLNALITKKMAEANDKYLEIEEDTNDNSAKAITDQLKNKIGNKSFFDLAEKYLDQLEKEGKHNRHSAEKPHINHFKEFTQGDINIKDITESLLRRYIAHLKSNRSIKERTVVNHLVVIRTLFNQAIQNGIVDSKHYPFGKGKIQIKFPDSLKIGLSQEEVSALESLNDDFTTQEKHAVNVWLFSFYLAGMRASDVIRLTWHDVEDGRLNYTMGKNNKSGSLKISQKAMTILQRYEKNQESKMIFGELENVDLTNHIQVQKAIKNCIKKFNTHLKSVATKLNINKKLTMHISRHTFGNLSGERIPIQMLQKLYRHSSITTTINYQGNFINKETDDALESVLDF